MPVNDGGTDHNAPIGGDQDSQNQGDIKAHFLRGAFEKAQRGIKMKCIKSVIPVVKPNVVMRLV